VEVESFGTVAQKNGAKAVAATLWAVADPSTRDLMVKFYQLYGAGAISKTQALRQAQLSLLQEPDLAQTKGPLVTRAEIISPGKATGCAALPAFPPDAAKPYAHPYYWSPFILFGNWR
jgi:CHAT domain-containing protein